MFSSIIHLKDQLWTVPGNFPFWFSRSFLFSQFSLWKSKWI